MVGSKRFDDPLSGSSCTREPQLPATVTPHAPEYSADDGFWQARECTQKLRNSCRGACDRSGGKPPRQVKSSQVTVVDQNQTTHDYMYTKAEMKCQVKSSRYPHGEHGARDLSAWGSALPGAPPVGNPWQ